MALAGVFVTDTSSPGATRTTIGLVHDVGADLAFASIVVASFASSAGGRAVALALTAGVIAGRVTGLPGLGQRLFAGTAIAWQLALLRRRSRRNAHLAARTSCFPQLG